MSATKFNGINLILLLITVAAIGVSVWSFATRPKTTAPAIQATALTDDGGDLASADSQPLETPRDQPARPRPKPAPVQPDVTPEKPPTPETTVAKTSPFDHGDAVIEGVVQDAAGKPVTSATVKARRSDMRLSPPEMRGNDLDGYRQRMARFLAEADRETRSTTTDGSGAFRFTGLDAARAYDLVATHEAGNATLESVAAGDKAVLVLAATVMLRGRVQTEDGTPIKLFNVRAWRQNWQWEPTTQDFRDDEGRFELPAAPGAMQLQVTADGFSQAQPMDVMVGPDAEEVVITLSPACILSGVVTDNGGKPVQGVRLYHGEGERGRRNWNGGRENTVTTDSKGRYRFPALPAGEQSITASLGERTATNKVTLQLGENSADFTLDVGCVVRIRATGPDGQPVELEQVWFQTGNDWPQSERLPRREPGLVEYAGLNPGDYVLTCTASALPAIRKEIKLVAGDNDVTLAFAAGATLIGTLTNSSGKAVTGVSVRLRKDDEDRWGGWGTGKWAQVRSDGSYRLGPVDPGSYNFEVYASGNWEPIHTTVFVVAVGENTQNLTVSTGATAVVTVTDESGNPVAGAEVQLSGARSYNGRTGSNGIAQIPFVTEGAYTLQVSGNGVASAATFVNLSGGENQLQARVQKPNCARITQVFPDSQAARAGLQVGDLIIEYNGTQITTWRQFGQVRRNAREGTDVTIMVERGGVALTFTLKAGTVGIDGTDGVR